MLAGKEITAAFEESARQLLGISGIAVAKGKRRANA